MANKTKLNKNEIVENKLTEDEVIETLGALNKAFDLQEFSQSYHAGAYTPLMQNALMKEVNLNIINPDKDKIESALKDPTNNESSLISYGQSYYFSNIMYKRNIHYLATMPSFDLEITCTNAKKEDYKSAAYKKDEQIVKDFLSQFDYRQEFKRAVWNMINQETYFCIFRQLGNKSVLQDFPWKYSKITGRWEYGILYDVDMTYFLQPQVDLDMFPSCIKKKYNDLFIKNKQTGYTPSKPIDHRNGMFAMWAQTDPSDGFWAFKFTPQHNAQIPFFSAMLPEMALIPTMRNLQLSQSLAAARKLLTSSIPYLQEKKSASVSQSLAIDPDVLGKFIGLATKALNDAIKTVTLPTEDIKGVEFQNTDKDSYKNFMSITSSLLSGGKMIFAPAGEKTNAIETQLSIDIDNQLVDSLYPQFSDFMNYWVNNKTKKYKFNFKFLGCSDYLSKTRRQEEAFAYADKGVVLPNKIATSAGLNKYELENQMIEAKETGFTDNLLSLINIFSQGAGGPQESPGAPKKPDNKLNDSTTETRDAGSNIEKGGKV